MVFCGLNLKNSPWIAIQSLAALFLFAACVPYPNHHNLGRTEPDFSPEVSQSKYLNGESFCKTYVTTAQPEYAVKVTVPANYDRPNEGTLTIYAYSPRPFDPAKPSFIFVDGGPGQTTHGADMIRVEDLGFNEIHFDQRGLGCSAPPTYTQYRDVSMYSSVFTAKDMESIRKAYGIKQWSIYGISYGTVPSTIYASLFPDAVVSLNLEGTVGSTDFIHQARFKAEKWNLIYFGLNEAQRQTFAKLITSDSSKESILLLSLLEEASSINRGYQKILKLIGSLILADGRTDQEKFKSLIDSIDKESKKYPNPQHPGATDTTVHRILFCKELSYRKQYLEDLSFAANRGFIVVDNSQSTETDKICNRFGVTKDLEKPYRFTDFLVNKPVYYFQGSHDGATLARGAFEHWQKVPQQKSYFFLSQKGGHNPNLTRFYIKDKSKSVNDDGYSTEAQNAQARLFGQALRAENLLPADLNELNNLLPEDEKWLLFDQKPEDIQSISKELEGLQMRLGFDKSF